MEEEGEVTFLKKVFCQKNMQFCVYSSYDILKEKFFIIAWVYSQLVVYEHALRYLAVFIWMFILK